MNTIKIIKEPTVEKPYIIAFKPAGLPSAPLFANDENNALSEVSKFFPEVLTVKGKKEIEHGLLHRIDTATSGLIIVSCNQNNYDYFTKLQSENKITKYYIAKSKKVDIQKKMEGFPQIDSNIESNKIIKLESFFRAYGEGRKAVRPVTENANLAALKKVEKKVLYTTNVQLKNYENDIYTFECFITNGYRHQVRCHLAWLGFPIIGDSVYNPEYAQRDEKIQFTAFKIDIDGDIYSL